MTDFRTEHDSMGDVLVPAQAYYGAQTQRAVENFPVSGWPLPKALIRSLGLTKLACAIANRDLGKLSNTGKNRLNDTQIDALLGACREVSEGKFDDQFPIDVFQTGSGTSSNMNANEVISNRAIEILGGDRFQVTKTVHPNDHVNMGQSTNDIFPTAIHVAVARSIKTELIPALGRFADVLARKAQEWDKIIKIGRTHLADATPLRLGQEIGGLARQLRLSKDRAEDAIRAVLELPAGGTAVGTGINTHPEFGRRVAEALARETGIPFTEAVNHFEGNAQRDGLVQCHGGLKTIASTLFNVANNIRWLGSGPRCGFYEIKLPDRQPGSSIMPGKVNPVMCESLMQVAARVIGNDATMVGLVKDAATATDERVWELPLERKYRKQLDSDVADLANIGGPYAGATTAALFLAEFVGETPWAHLDIASTMQSEADDSWRSKGATGFGARLLIEVARGFQPAK